MTISWGAVPRGLLLLVFLVAESFQNEPPDLESMKSKLTGILFTFYLKLLTFFHVRLVKLIS